LPYHWEFGGDSLLAGFHEGYQPALGFRIEANALVAGARNLPRTTFGS